MIKNINLKTLWNEIVSSLDTDKEEVTENLFVSFFNDVIDTTNTILKTSYYHIENTNNFYIGLPAIMHSIIKKGIKTQYYEYDSETETKIQRVQTNFNNYLFTLTNDLYIIPIQFKTRIYRNMENSTIQKYLYYNNTLEKFKALTEKERNEYIINNVYIDDGYYIYNKLYNIDPTKYIITYTEPDKIEINWENMYKKDKISYLSTNSNNSVPKRTIHKVVINLKTAEEI